MAFMSDIVSGILVGMWYDFLKVSRHNVRRRAFWLLCDVLFWVLTGGFLVVVFFVTSDMELRAYEFLGVLTGVCIYFFFLGGFLMPVFEKISQFLLKIFQFLFTMVKMSAIMIKNGVVFLLIPFSWLQRFFSKLLVKPKRWWKEHRKLRKRI